MRFVEIALFASPVLMFAAWRALVMTGAATRTMVICATLFVAGMVGMLLFVWYEGTEPPGAYYVPAREVDGRIIPGHVEYPGKPAQ